MTVVIFTGQIVAVKRLGSKWQLGDNWLVTKSYVGSSSFARPFYASGCVVCGPAHIWQAWLRVTTLTLKLGQAQFP
jgi:hypothetical protein